MTTHSRKLAIPFVVAGALALGACENMNSTQQRTLSGGAIGAAAGAAGTIITGGCTACGAALGGAVGAGAGYLSDKWD